MTLEELLWLCTWASDVRYGLVPVVIEKWELPQVSLSPTGMCKALGCQNSKANDMILPVPRGTQDTIWASKGRQPHDGWRCWGESSSLEWELQQRLGVIPHLRLCWVSRCLRRSTLRWKPLAQSSQLKGLKPVCLRLWVMRLELWLKALPHTWHLWGFSPAGQRKC